MSIVRENTGEKFWGDLWGMCTKFNVRIIEK